jgi:hypothetical protein
VDSRNFVGCSRTALRQREALLLVEASGISDDERLQSAESAVGTMKSRVNRARTRLSKLLSIYSADRFGEDHTTRVLLTVGSRPGHFFGEGCLNGHPLRLLLTLCGPF